MGRSIGPYSDQLVSQLGELIGAVVRLLVERDALLAECLALLAESPDSQYWGIRSANFREKLRAALGQQKGGVPE